MTPSNGWVQLPQGYSHFEEAVYFLPFRGVALIRGRLLFQCGYPKVQPLLEESTYLRSGAYQRKYSI